MPEISPVLILLAIVVIYLLMSINILAEYEGLNIDHHAQRKHSIHDGWYASDSELADLRRSILS